MSRTTRVGGAAIHVAGALVAGAAALAIAIGAGCAKAPERLRPAETFTWVRQPIAFSPPSEQWYREGDNGGGMLGVRFILTGGGGQCISVLAYRMMADRDRSEALRGLVARGGSLPRRLFLDSLSLARPRTEDPISERESAMARELNAALDRAMEDYLSERTNFVSGDLEAALRIASAYEPTMEEVLPRIRLVPSRMQEPERWRIAYERDTTLAGLPAFASDDTLFTPERPLLYREVFWVVHGCAFKAVYQGTDENLKTFYRVVDSIRFPEVADAAAK